MTTLTVGELLERLKQEKLAQVAESVGVSPSTIQRRLKRLGYEWDNSDKQWEWTGNDAQPLDVNLLEDVKVIQSSRPVHTKVTIGSHSIHKEVTADSPKSYRSPQTGYSQFTQEEVNDLKQLLADWRKGRTISESRTLDELIRELPAEPSKRGTVIILESVRKKLEKLKKQGYDKSDIYNLALLEFFQKHDLHDL